MSKLDTSLQISSTSNTIEEVIKTVIAESDLNQNEFAVLELLYQAGDKPIQQLGKKIQVASSSITYVVDKLEKRGYVRRKPCATDRRVMYASVTESGEQLMQTLLPVYENRMAALFEGCTEKEIQRLNRILNQVEKNAEKICNGTAV